MGHLTEIVKQTILEYAGGGYNLETFPVSNEEKQVYALLIVNTPVPKYPAAIVVSTRVAGDRVIIDEDTTDRPFADALVRNGVPPEKIIKAYAGEPIPEDS